MTTHEPEIKNGEKPPPDFQHRLKEAELYLQQGLLNEAQAIYAGLHQALCEKLERDDASEMRPSVRRQLKRGVSALEVRLKEVDQQKAILDDTVVPTVKKVGADLSAENMIKRGALLHGLGFFNEAIDEFRHAMAQDSTLVGECYEHIGDALVGKGAVEEGVDMLRSVIDIEKDNENKRLEILEKIAQAFESVGDKQKAVSAYRELILINTTFGHALQKIEQLSAELKQSPLELAMVCRYPKRFFAVTFLLALVFMVFNPFVKMVDNVDYFTIEDHPEFQFYEAFKGVFGNDEFFVIAFESDDLFSVKRLEMLQQISAQLAEMDEVADVISLGNADDIVGGPDYFEVKPFLDEIPEEKEALEALASRAAKNEFFLKNLISEDKRTAAILVEPSDRPDDPKLRERLIHNTRALLAPYEKDGLRFYLGGWTTTNYSLSKYLNTDMMVFVPLTYLLITVALWLFFRNIRLTVLAIINISFCVGTTRGLMGMVGISVNNVTTIIIPLVMALALCDTVHIFAHMDRRLLERFSDERLALAHVLKRVGLPCFLTTVTTAIGFLSLSVSEIPPIKEFAWIAAAGMVFEFIFSFFFLPPLILFCKPDRVFQTYTAGSRMKGFLQALFQNVRRYYVLVLALGFVVLMGAGWATSRLKIETNLLEFFKKSSPVRVALDFVEKRLSGVGSLDISFQSPEPEAFKDPENLQIIETVQQYVRGLGGVDKAISFNNFLKDMNQAFHNEDPAFYRIPESFELVSQYLLLYDSDDIEDYVNADFDHARLAIRLSVYSSHDQKLLINEINNYLGGIDHKDLRIRVTGRAVNSVNLIDTLVNSQLSSLALATVVISIIMFLVFRSVSISFLSMIPNLFPILLNFGIMGLCGIPLDTGTALIAAVALGIAVDDTIHFLSEYQQLRAQGHAIPEALGAVTQNKGRAIISSSLILCIGFGVMVFSRFMPVVHFGLLCAIIMVTAAIGDLIFLPAIMLLGRDKNKSKAAPKQVAR